MTLSSGVFTVTLKGHALFPSTTAGLDVLLDMNGYSYTFTDDSGTSDLTDLGFGITETADWAADMPFFLYLVNEDNTPANVGLFISRSPSLFQTPGATYIHDLTAAAANDTQLSIFGAWADDASKASVPCILIGAIRMRWSTTTDDWTIQTLANVDGIGQDRLDKTFGRPYTMADAQNGANATTDNYCKAANTPPVWQTPANTLYYYTIDRDGWIDCLFNTANSGNATNGSHAEAVYLALPTAPLASWYAQVTLIPAGFGRIAAAAAPDEVLMIAMTTTSYVEMFSPLGVGVQGNDFSDVGDDLVLQFRYKAF